MSTYIFLAGMGAGAVIATIFFLILLCVLGNARRESKEVTQETFRLMKERNATAQQMEGHAKKIADWCVHNFDIANPNR